MKIMLAFAIAAFLVGCEGEKVGDPCDKFFQNTCKSPLSCVDMNDKKVCAGSCEMITPKAEPTVPGQPPPRPPMPALGCKDPAYEMSQVQYEKSGTSLGSAGCYCLPKK